MKWYRVLALPAAAAAAALLVQSASASEATGLRADAVTTAEAPGVVWGTAQQVPGMAALNSGDDADITALSCGSAGNCSAGGYYTASNKTQAFVVSESGGTWGTAQEVPGTAALNAGGDAEVTALSCASVGNCSAGGYYASAKRKYQAFVVSESGGTWATAQEVPGTAALNAGNSAQIFAVSCASAGSCAAGGSYANAPDTFQAFVVSESGGAWGAAQEVPGTAALNAGGDAEVSALSCSSAGDCSVGGYYSDTSDYSHAFVVTESGGAWGTAQELPGTAALENGGSSYVGALSCASAGNCAAGGEYFGLEGTPAESFVADQTDGTWGTAEEVPGLGALNAGDTAGLSALSCPSEGNCSAGGDYTDSKNRTQAFVVDQTDGVWGHAKEVPGTAALNEGVEAQTLSVSCGSAGNCAAGGFYANSSDNPQAFLADETGGVWAKAEEVPGTGVLNAGDNASVTAISCPTTGACSAAGFYRPTLKNGPSGQVFVVGQVEPSATKLTLSAPAAAYGDEQAEKFSVAVTAGTSAGTPAGSVAVATTTGVAVCTITLVSGAGSCTAGKTVLPAGKYRLIATYKGDSQFGASESGVEAFSVSKAASAVALALSKATITYGKETAERLSVSVSPRYSGTPTGSVTIKTATGSAVCTITLGKAKGSCTLTAKQLKPGKYDLVATYQGSIDFLASTSPKKAIKVVS
jgi:hypothetical protein